MHDPVEFRVLYLFAGPSRPTGIPETLEKLAGKSKRPVKVTVEPFDTLRDAKHDLLDEGLRTSLLERIAQGYYDAVIMSPPCGTWSRAPWALGKQFWAKTPSFFTTSVGFSMVRVLETN